MLEGYKTVKKCFFTVAKSKSLFNDMPAEIQELTYIKEDLDSLNQQIARLQEVSKAQRQSVPYSSGQHMFIQASRVVLALQPKLSNMSNELKQVLGYVQTEVSYFAMHKLNYNLIKIRKGL